MQESKSSRPLTEWVSIFNTEYQSQITPEELLEDAIHGDLQLHLFISDDQNIYLESGEADKLGKPFCGYLPVDHISLLQIKRNWHAKLHDYARDPAWYIELETRLLEA